MDRDIFEIVTNYNELPDGAEVIREQKHWSKSGFPTFSTFTRCRVGRHMTVGGPAVHLVPEPSFEFPEIPPWEWIYPGDPNCLIWRRKDGSDQQKSSD